MLTFKDQQKDKPVASICAFLLMLTLAFIQCYRTTHNLHWSNDGDFYRDMAFIQGTLEGHFGQDPNMAGAYLWYNPLVFLIEALIVRISGSPINDVVLQAGTYLNVLGPLAFFVMVSRIFNYKIALASSLSYLFLATGDIPGCAAATYSPWLYPGCFSQFLFYVNILLCYLAFSSNKYIWFIITGFAIGINFLGHSAPVVLIVLIMIWIQGTRVTRAAKTKDYSQIRIYLLQGLATFVPFVIASMPLLYYIVGKYHLHFLNRYPFELVDTIFIWHNFSEMLRENLSISFAIALIGFVWFYRNVRESLVRSIFLGWFFLSILMFIYSTVVASVDRHFDIHLPGTVPSFHYFHYLKALQSIFFGFGLVYLFQLFITWASQMLAKRTKWTLPASYSSWAFICLVLLYALIYFPKYEKRYDFGYPLEHLVVLSDINKDKIDAYHYIVQHISSDKVILCEQGDPSIFPVMPAGRKMVSVGISYSNPYHDFTSREADRNNMISFLETGQPLAARQLFNVYQVSIVVLSHDAITHYKIRPATVGQVIFSNSEFTIYSIPG
jgi:hypothetical protein